MLVEQLKEEFPKMQTLKGAADYPCETPRFGPRGGKYACGECLQCRQRVSDIRRSHVVPYSAMNYWTYYAYRNYNHTLIIDEGHRVLDMLKDLASHKFPWRTWRFPKDAQSTGDILLWASKKAEAGGPAAALLGGLVADMTSTVPSYVIKIEDEWFDNKWDTVLKFIPLDARKAPPFLWPGKKVKKIILLSATIGHQDIVDMGLDACRVMTFECSSPIPAVNRPIIYDGVANMALAHQEEDIEKLATKIKQLAEQHPERGLIHATYKVAEMLRRHIHSNRFIWHTKDDKREQFDTFTSTEGAILIASGMQEGIDLPYDLCRWQVITQIPYPSLEDVAVKTRLEMDPEWYTWNTIKMLLQACGRVCRTPDDYGRTYVLDVQFVRLREHSGHLFPAWFKEAII